MDEVREAVANGKRLKAGERKLQLVLMRLFITSSGMHLSAPATGLWNLQSIVPWLQRDIHDTFDVFASTLQIKFPTKIKQKLYRSPYRSLQDPVCGTETEQQQV